LEIADELGLSAEAVPLDALSVAAKLSSYGTLLLGAVAELPAGAEAALERWVRNGGRLLVLGGDALHDLCGNRRVGMIRQPDDAFTIAATFALVDHPLTRDIHSRWRSAQRLLALSDVCRVKPEGSVELARLYDRRGRDTGCAAVTERRLGRGRVFYFAFGVAQTMWALHQGRPVDADRDGDGLLRRSDAIVIGSHASDVAYADEILFLLQSVIGTQPQPFVHQLPPTPDRAVPAALFYIGGDDEASSDGIQLTASNFMRERGLPYHVNAMPTASGDFGLSVEDAALIRANGHEVSLHFNFMDGFAVGSGFTREDVFHQAEAFRRRFGSGWTCSVNHCCRWFGWAEPARWMLEAGGKADNSWVHRGSPPMNPVNEVGFAFGTAFPFWFYDDWRGGNRRLAFLEEPITAYECGYVGRDGRDFETIRRVIEIAMRYHYTMNLFYHPVYIATYPACRAAIEEHQRCVAEWNVRAFYMGNDALYEWWKARSETRIRDAVYTGKGLRFTVETPHPSGAIVKVPQNRLRVRFVRVGAERSEWYEDRRFGKRWAYIVIPYGVSDVTVGFVDDEAYVS
jgi:hypothetical protein